MFRTTCITTIVTILAVSLLNPPARSATLPPHAPLRILIVSDEVNPHSLPDSQLTQPGEISAALIAAGSGLNIDVSVDAVLEIATNDLPMATSQLQTPAGDPAAYDVLVYFAHRIPNGASGAQEQADFVAAVDSFLIAGGGVVSFHHGVYQTAGKESMQDIIGCTATGSVPWDTVNGQNVINVSPAHFITSNEIESTGSVAYADPANGVAAGTYDFFNNTPDERYPNLVINPTAGNIEILFASDYVNNGATHVLGLTHTRPEWLGSVVMYQPGEYQPNALDDLDGNNFQILANAIYYVTQVVPTGIADLPIGGAVLAQNFPNPFNPTTTIAYEITTAGPAAISVYTASGALVKELTNRTHTPGRYVTTWQGEDANGEHVASGIYFYRLTHGVLSQTRKMLLLK